LIDVREVHERALGMAEGALGVARGELESAPASSVPDRNTAVMLICEVGGRSLQAAKTLADRGYAQVASVEGGTSRWRDDGLPLVRPVGDHDFYDRYSRHLLLPEVGEAGQRKLQAARVAIVGAGGLGSPSAYYLAAAGVGSLVLADDDVVDRSNLQRQILHTDARIGMAKVESARIALSALNPNITIETFAERITSANVERLIGDADVVLDGGDNFAVRYLLNDACVKLGKPMVYGAVHRFHGQVSVFDAGRRRGEAPCYRCLFPQPPSPESAPNCSEAGVLGVLPGVIGMLQATEVIKLLLGIGEPLSGRLLHFDALGMHFRQTRLSADPACAVCAPGQAFPGYIDYEAFCSAR
jgi:molybdopterin/thiamine biosynthesis adenylyltransferase/rhodanese-related sulfurtransferase